MNQSKVEPRGGSGTDLQLHLVKHNPAEKQMEVD